MKTEEEKKFTYSDMLKFAQHLMVVLLTNNNKDVAGVDEISGEDLTRIYKVLDKFTQNNHNLLYWTKELEKQKTFILYDKEDENPTWFNCYFDMAISARVGVENRLTGLKEDVVFFCFHDEINGKLTNIKKLKDIDDLKNLYKAITNEDLI